MKSRAKLQKPGFFLYTRFQPLAVRTISAEKFGLVDKSHIEPSRISSQLLFLLPCHNGHQQGGRQQLLRRGACPHKGRGHNDDPAVHHAVHGFLYAELRRDALEGKHHPRPVVELGIHRPRAERTHVDRAVQLLQLPGRIYDKIGAAATAKVKYVLANAVVCSVKAADMGQAGLPPVDPATGLPFGNEEDAIAF